MKQDAEKPKPMTPNEQKTYCSLVPLARRAAIRFARKHRVCREEAVAEAMLLLVGIMREYRAWTGVDLQMFVLQRVQLRLADQLRVTGFESLTRRDFRQGKKGVQISAVGDHIDTTQDHAASDMEARSMLDRLKTTGVRWEMVEVLLGWRTNVEVGRQLGLSVSRVSLMRTEAVRLLQGVEWLQREAQP